MADPRDYIYDFEERRYRRRRADEPYYPAIFLTHEFVRDFTAAALASQREIEMKFEDPIEHMTPDEFQEWYVKYWPLTM